MSYRLVLWDFDGTLADTLPRLLRVYNDLAGRHGFRAVADPEAVRDLTPLRLLRSHGIPLVRLPSLLGEMLAAMKDEMATVPLFPGILDALQAIRRTGCRLAVLSSNVRENILTCLRAGGGEELFEAVAGYPTLFGKARGMRRLLRTLAVPRREALYVGDEVRDIEAARKAGVQVGAVTWGFNTRELLARHGPDFLVDRPDQLPDSIARRGR